MTLKQIKDYPQSAEYHQVETGMAHMCRGRQDFATSLGSGMNVSAGVKLTAPEM